MRVRKPARPQIFRAQPKPKWVKHEVIRLKALMPQAGCRTIAHHFNRRRHGRRQMTVSNTYVAGMCRAHQYLIYEARRHMKHRVPRPMPRNLIWGCDLLTKTDQQGTSHLALAGATTHPGGLSSGKLLRPARRRQTVDGCLTLNAVPHGLLDHDLHLKF